MTVWHLSESDVVNMVPADSTVEIVHSGGALRHSYSMAQLPSTTPMLLCLHRGSMCVYVQTIFPSGSKVSRISRLHLSLPAQISLARTGIPLRVHIIMTVKAKELHRILTSTSRHGVGSKGSGQKFIQMYKNI